MRRATASKISLAMARASTCAVLRAERCAAPRRATATGMCLLGQERCRPQHAGTATHPCRFSCRTRRTTPALVRTQGMLCGMRHSRKSALLFSTSLDGCRLQLCSLPGGCLPAQQVCMMQAARRAQRPRSGQAPSRRRRCWGPRSGRPGAAAWPATSCGRCSAAGAAACCTPCWAPRWWAPDGLVRPRLHLRCTLAAIAQHAALPLHVQAGLCVMPERPGNSCHATGCSAGAAHAQHLPVRSTCAVRSCAAEWQVARCRCLRRWRLPARTGSWSRSTWAAAALTSSPSTAARSAPRASPRATSRRARRLGRPVSQTLPACC